MRNFHIFVVSAVKTIKRSLQTASVSGSFRARETHTEISPLDPAGHFCPSGEAPWAIAPK